MSPIAFRYLLDAYVRASVDLEFCHMNGYNKKNKRVEKIKDKLMDVYYESKFWNNKQRKISIKESIKILKEGNKGQ